MTASLREAAPLQLQPRSVNVTTPVAYRAAGFAPATAAPATATNDTTEWGRCCIIAI
jgi:hypothetical protein